MVDSNNAPGPSAAQDPLCHILGVLNAPERLAQLGEEHYNGRQGYPVKAMWQAYVASFILNLPHTNALIRRMEDHAGLRHMCGFGDILPHRTTFNRFIQRLSYHSDLVEACFRENTARFRLLLGYTLCTRRNAKP